MIPSKEGCLSLEDGDVTTRKRHQTIALRSFNPARQLTQEYFNDSAAVVVQHEMDHLDGRMCNDRENLSDLSQENKSKKQT